MKRTISFILLMVMMLSLFAGCKKELEKDITLDGKTVHIAFDDDTMNCATITDGEDVYRIEKVNKDITITYPNGGQYFYKWDETISLWDMSQKGDLKGYFSHTDIRAAYNDAK